MSDEFDDEMARYEEAAGSEPRALDNGVLLRPISSLRYPRHPLAFAPDTPVGAVLETMTTRRIGAVLVESDGKVTGIFTERDALMKGLYAGASPERPVADFMTRDPACLTPHDPIALALNRMAVGGYRHVPLVDPSGRSVGMLVMRDVVRFVVSHFPAEVLNRPPHSEHAPPDHDLHGG